MKRQLRPAGGTQAGAANRLAAGRAERRQRHSSASRTLSQGASGARRWRPVRQALAHLLIAVISDMVHRLAPAASIGVDSGRKPESSTVTLLRVRRRARLRWAGDVPA